MAGEADPYAVLGVTRDASDAELHHAYRTAVRRTHPDGGGSTAAFEAVQEAYETLRDPRRRRSWDERHAAARPRPRAASADPPGGGRAPADGADGGGRSMEELLAQSRRLEAQARALEDEARRLGGLPPRDGSDDVPPRDGEDSLGAIARDAAKQLRDAAEEVRSAVRRWL